MKPTASQDPHAAGPDRRSVASAVVAGVSRLVGVPVGLRALAWTAVAAGIATAGSLAVLFPDFAAFAFVGGFLVAGIATSTYAVGTSRDLEAWRDGHLP